MAKEWQHMDQIWGNFKVISSMNLVLLWFFIYVSLTNEVLANVEFYPGKYHDYTLQRQYVSEI
jgi:hypothetical protein